MTDPQLTTEALRDATSTPIAQLNPDIDNPQTRAVQGVITIIWPFSIVTKSIAFILAESDFRLRRENGQVRLRFHGASAKAIADAKLGGGDEVRLSLQGTKWEKNEMETQLAGSTLEWQLEFTNRLFLSVQRAGEGEEELRVIDVDVPEVDEVVTNGTTHDIETNEHQSNADLAIPIPQSPEVSLPSKRPVSPNLEAQELASPAFIKRARLSYGSLFEGGFDIFDEPQSKKKKKSKRPSRFSLPANSWRYSSRSPSPEAEEVDGEPEESDHEEESNHTETHKDTTNVPMPKPTPTRPEMVDGGCQTDDVDFTPMASVQVSAEARPAFGFPYATPTPLPRSRPEDLTQAHPLNFQVGGPTSQGSVIQDATTFHTPAHLDPSLEFSFVSPQSNMFAGPNFSNAQAQDGNVGAEHIQHHPQMEQYATTFLDTQTQPSTATHSFHSVHEEVEPQASERPHVHFEPEPQFYAPFEEEGLAQPPREEWPTSQFTAANAIQNPADFINSSPVREEDAPNGERSTPARSSSAPSEQEEATGLQEILDKRPEYDREDEVDAPPTEEQGFYKEGGDRPGDDYDLRNYDRAHDDDDDVVGSSEASADIDTDDPDAQIINPEEDNVDEEDDNIDEDVDDYERGDYGEYEGEEEGEGEYYSDEEMYDEEDEEGDSEEEYDESPPQPAASKEPVFISLLSDSEDEDEAEPEPESASQPEPQRAEEPRPETEPESEPQSESESDSGEETGSGDELPMAPPREVEQVPEVEEPESPEEPQSPADESEGSMESDRDEDLAEDTGLIGQEPPSEDRMEVDGDQSPEPSVRSPESKSSLQISQDTHPVGQEENESASLSIERGVPANEDHGDSDRANIDISVVEMEVAPATPQQSKGDEQVQDEIQVSEMVKIEEIVTTSGDAMEVDDTQVVQSEEENQDVGIVTASANDRAATVQPNSGTPAEDATTGMENHEEPINVEATNVVEVLAEIVVAPGPVSSLPSASNVYDQRTTQVEEDITETAPETQGSGPTRSPDATLQETFQLATTEHKPSDKAPGSQSDHGESYEETNEDQHNTPFSPPATQVFQSQISKDDEAALLPEAPTTASTHNIDGNLPTPHDTQQDAEMSAHYPAEEYHGIQGEDEQGGADNQIIKEFLQHSPERLEDIQKTSPAELGASPIKVESAGVRDEEKPWQGEHGSEVPSTGKALRSRGHMATRSSDLNKASQQDPGVESARVPLPHPHGDDEKYSSPRTILRVTRSRADVPDPSSQLARASQVAEDSKGTGDSPTGTIRVTRSMTEHSDTTSALAKGSSPSARQSRRQYTPEVPHRETRASSRSFMKSDSPDVNESMLQSPSVRSVAGSSTVEDENANALKLQLLKSLRTSMPEYLSLKLLRNSLNKTVDMLAVATTTPAQPQRPKGGPRDYMLSLNLTDPSTAPINVVVANLFRPHQASLPVVHAGDIVLLRRVQVVSMKNRGFGVRTGDSSAWAVFEKGDPEMLPQIKGPPVETSDEEVKYAEGLRRWWNLLDEKSMDKIDKVSRKITEASKEHKEP